MAEYRILTDAEFKYLWDRNEAADPEEPMWPVWRARFEERIARGQAICFGVILDGNPVGEGTLELSTSKDPRLCNGKDTAYLAALRIYREYEGQGHISRLVKTMEDHARRLGYTALTIGVELKQSRNLAIYSHWGYTDPVFQQIQDGETVAYFRKRL